MAEMTKVAIALLVLNTFGCQRIIWEFQNQKGERAENQAVVESSASAQVQDTRDVLAAAKERSVLMARLSAIASIVEKEKVAKKPLPCAAPFRLDVVLHMADEVLPLVQKDASPSEFQKAETERITLSGGTHGLSIGFEANDKSAMGVGWSPFEAKQALASANQSPKLLVVHYTKFESPTLLGDKFIAGHAQGRVLYFEGSKFMCSANFATKQYGSGNRFGTDVTARVLLSSQFRDELQRATEDAMMGIK